MLPSAIRLLLLSSCVLCGRAYAQPFTWALADGNANWPAGMKDTITQSMNEAAALSNQYGWFEKHDTANYSSGVPTAQSNYDGWIDFGHQYNTRTALHEIAHTLGVGTYWAFDNGTWNVDSAAGRLEKIFDGQDAVLSTGGTHFWPYGLNYDTEDGPAARERHCKMVAALRFDMGIVQDSDKDGLPDDWETLHFQGLSQSADGDPDADGITNADEYASDSDPNERCPVRDGHTYVVRTQASDRALSSSPGDKLVLHQAELPAQQHWTAHYVEGGFWRLESADSGLVLALPGTDSSSAIPLQLANWDASAKQQWRIVSGPGGKAGYFWMANRQTGRAADCLDGGEGTAVEQYPFLGGLQQQFWKFEEVVSASTSDAGVPDAGGRGAADAAVIAPIEDGGADAGSARRDASTQRDAAFPSEAPVETTHDSGCALSRSSTAAAWYAAIALLSAARLRRRRPARS